MRPNITFQKQQGRSGRTIPGQDYVSALIFYCANGSLPSGYDTNNRIKQFLTLLDAEAAGIKDDYSDGTAATGSYEITDEGAAGDKVVITVDEPLGVVTEICNYIVKSGDSSPTLLGVSIAAAINAGTKDHGYVAVAATGTVTITSPKKFGIFLNSGTPITVTITGTVTGTLVQFTGGAFSKQAVWHYHIKEFFRIQNGSNGTDGLFVGFFAIPDSYDFTEVTTIQNFAEGAIRQVGIFKDSEAYASGDITLIDAKCKALDALKKNISALYSADLAGTSDISTIADLSSLTANKVSSIIGQDGGALGNFLFLTTGKSVTVLGAALGSLSKSAVSEDFGQPIDKFNMSEGGGLECDVLAFANGKLFKDASITDTLLDSIDAKRHIFLQKYVGFAGSYFNDNHCAVVTSSDYAFINDNRVIDKAIRGIYVSELPLLKSKLLLNSDGTLADTTIETLRNAALAPLFQMVRDGDLSEVIPNDVYISPTQNVKQTNILIVEVNLNEDAIARQIQIPIGFKSN